MAIARKTGEKGKQLGLWIGLSGFLFLLAVPIDPTNGPASRLAAVALLMAVWWVTDAIPLFATAMLPLVLFPLLGIMTGRATAPVYFNSTIVLFLGGFIIALTMEKWNLHRRIALNIINAVGGGPSRIVLGFMIAAAFLSMWISNTATAVMMVPIGLAMVLQLEDEFGKEKTHSFTVGLMLGIAYGCSVGGLTTLVGTPPNLSFVRIFEILFPEAPSIAFGQWLVMAFPIGLIMLVTAWFFITKVFYKTSKEITVDQGVVAREKDQLGLISYEERWVLAVFAATALLWVFRVDLNVGLFVIPGWSRFLPFQGMIDDGTIAIGMAGLLFFVPTKNRESGAMRITERDIIPRLPWNIVLLFGGGFALAAGFQQTGLAQLIGDQFEVLSVLPTFVMILLVCLALTFLTELTSNLATTEMILPILAAVAVVTEMNPLILMIPATISASCAFMMPVATPPNAIVFGSDRISVGEMARIGLVLNLIGAVVVAILVYTVGTVVFDIDPNIVPDWATSIASGLEG
ncbi:MAG: SLC13/DASS family transporter [Gemmatimonadales bacterium]|jgi:sodium-dependent dicarboxylate transporter 2/3/5|nr:SLC13/DASS family transporter [Gemmatimonadales bacterium]MDG2239793.1 SLC13 family permease [Longimicrobiales bacterium]NCG34180.1 DASS family sodium-coupled anion symporter [Pseudomonadota bacterium]MBT3500497.1 SLC13/DASS family transporter [Gemmatimonadales bacterium]MBT3773993.1 SLC13/DASS family transporter [Gemmatimonadales bacterium]